MAFLSQGCCLDTWNAKPRQPLVVLKLGGRYRVSDVDLFVDDMEQATESRVCLANHPGRELPLKSFPAVGCPVIRPRLAITRFAVCAPGIGFGVTRDLVGMFCRSLIHLPLLSLGLHVELRIGGLFVEVLFGHGDFLRDAQ